MLNVMMVGMAQAIRDSYCTEIRRRLGSLAMSCMIEIGRHML